MNEQIIEMAKQCGYWSGQTIEMNDVGIMKFAELIVRECIRIDVENPDAKPGVEIAHHFGVEL
jgi:hypothetical protein